MHLVYDYRLFWLDELFHNLLDLYNFLNNSLDFHRSIDINNHFFDLCLYNFSALTP